VTLDMGGVRHRRVLRVEHVDRDSRPVVERESETGPPGDEEPADSVPLARGQPSETGATTGP